MKIEIQIGDITMQAGVDVIVNAAKPQLTGGGGVDGAIHAAAGPKLLEACMAIEPDPDTVGLTVHDDINADIDVRCHRGNAVVTPAFDLPNKFVVHTAGPIYTNMEPREAAQTLRECYIKSVMAATMAMDHKPFTIAFPAIGTGIYGYPLESATTVAIQTLVNVYRGNPNITIKFVCFDATNYLVYDRVLSAVLSDWKRIEEI